MLLIPPEQDIEEANPPNSNTYIKVEGNMLYRLRIAEPETFQAIPLSFPIAQQRLHFYPK
jgi:hypothetical protein